MLKINVKTMEKILLRKNLEWIEAITSICFPADGKTVNKPHEEATTGKFIEAKSILERTI